MTGAANRRRGADAERAVVAYLRSVGFPDARRYLAGDGRQPGDIDFAPGVCLEVKDRASSAWPTWRAQLVDEAREFDLLALVVRTRGLPDVGRWPCQTPLAQWHGEVNDDPQWLTFCRRTNRWWVAMPFAEWVETVAVTA